MQEHDTVEYDTRALQKQMPRIQKSRLKAFQKLATRSHILHTGLRPDEPPELWRYVVGRSTLPTEFASRKQARELVERIRKRFPDFAGDHRTYREFRKRLGRPTLRQTAAALAARAKNDAKLAIWLSKLLTIYKGWNTRAKPEDRKDAETLCEHWVGGQPPNPFFSLCFFSDLAMAKLVYFLRHKEWLADYDQDPQIERISKLYQRLGLVPAKPRIIRDLEFRNGRIRFIPFKTAIAR